MRSTRILLTVCVTLVAGAMATVALASPDQSSDDPASSASAITEVSASLPQRSRDQAIHTGGLDSATTSAQGYALTTRDTTVWIVRDGTGHVCMVDGPTASCGPDDGGPHGLLSVDAPAPHPEYIRAGIAAQEAGLSGEESLEFVRKATEHLPPVSGAATFLGYIDPTRGAELAVLIDANGSTLAQAEVRYGLYEFLVPDVARADPREIRLEGEALGAPITLGPFPGERL